MRMGIIKGLSLLLVLCLLGGLAPALAEALPEAWTEEDIELEQIEESPGEVELTLGEEAPEAAEEEELVEILPAESLPEAPEEEAGEADEAAEQELDPEQDPPGEIVEEICVEEDPNAPAELAITRNLNPQTVFTLGMSTYMYIQATGSGLTYQWQYRDPGELGWHDSSMEGARTSQLIFNNVPMSFNERIFRCVVTDSGNNTLASNHTTLYVRHDIEFKVHPGDTTVADGAHTSFNVIATGDGLTYRWMWRASPYDDWKDTTMEGWNTAHLQVTAQAAFNGRQYRCWVCDKWNIGDYTSFATLTVAGRAGILTQPAAQSVAAGGKATFSITAQGNGLRYQWQWRDAGETTWKNTSLAGATTASLSFTAQSGFDGRRYRCVVTDSSGGSVFSNLATLTVRTTAKITAQPVSCTVVEGQYAWFTVGAQGDGLRCRWQWRSGSGGSWADTSLAGASSPTLGFVCVKGFSGRQYRCKVTDKYGNEAFSNPATLTVRSYARLISQTGSVTVAEGGTATFQVTAAGDGLKYRWRYREAGELGWKNTALNGWSTAKLSFAAPASFANRQYQCQVTDQYGNTAYSSPATLRVIVTSTRPRELSALFTKAGKELETLLTSMGLSIIYTNTFDEDGITWTAIQYYDKPVIVYINENDVNTACKWEIALFENGDWQDKAYSVMGVRLDMTRAQAENRLLSAGFALVSQYDMGNGNIDYAYQNENAMPQKMSLYVNSDGVVDTLYAFYDGYLN